MVKVLIMANQKVVRTLTGFLLFQFGMGFRVRHSLKHPTVVWGTEGWVSGGNGHVRLNERIVELRWNLIDPPFSYSFSPTRPVNSIKLSVKRLIPT